MGLDVIEILMEVEEAFGVRIDNESAQRMRTVGDPYDYICARFSDAPRGCASARCFYRLRQALIAEFGFERRALGPKTVLPTILPALQRRRAWAAMTRTSGLRLPGLERHTLVALLVWTFSQLGSMYLVAKLPGAGAIGWPLLCFVWAVLAVLGFFATLPLAVVFPEHMTTLGDLTHAVLARNFPRLTAPDQNIERTDIWDVLKAILVEQLNVAPGAVHRDARIVEDLGAD